VRRHGAPALLLLLMLPHDILAHERWHQGTGKTIICIALILATRGTLASPPDLCETHYPRAPLRPERPIALRHATLAPSTAPVSVPGARAPAAPPPVPSLQAELRDFATHQQAAINAFASTTGAPTTTAPVAPPAPTARAPAANKRRAKVVAPPRAPPPIERGNLIPALTELCAFAIQRAGTAATGSVALPFELANYISTLPKPWYTLYNDRSACRHGTLRKPSSNARNILLSSSTLIIVPSNLIEQWQSEFYKVCEAPSYYLPNSRCRSLTRRCRPQHTQDDVLKILIVKDSKTPLPIASKLAEYDVVLMSLTRLRFEGSLGTASKLFDLRWLRIIVDEGTALLCSGGAYVPVTCSPTRSLAWSAGHVIGRRATIQAHLANEISAERRWCCTGTPTPGSLLSNEVSTCFRFRLVCKP